MVLSYLATLSGWKFALVAAGIIVLVELIVHAALDAADSLQPFRRS